MTRAVLLVLPGLALLGPSAALAQGIAWDGAAIRRTGPQTLTGPLTLTCASCASGGTAALAIPSGAKLCLNGTGCTGSLDITSGYMRLYAPTAIYAYVPLTAGSTLYVQSLIENAGAYAGGSVAFNDAIRHMSTTTALFESSTVATGGVDAAFAYNSLNTLAAGDYLAAYYNNGVTAVAIRPDGVTINGASGLTLTPGVASSVVIDSTGSGGNRIQLSTAGTFASNNTTTISNLGTLLSVKLLGTITDTNGASGVATILDNNSTLTVAGAKLVSARNNTVEKANIDKDGFVQIGIGNASACPTCDAGQRMKLCPVAGGAAVADTVSVCTKDASDVYAWRSVY